MTAIEVMIGRELLREHVDVVCRFVPGQLAAKLVPVEPVDQAEATVTVGEISYVDDAGEAWLIGASHEVDGWRPLYAYRGGSAHTEKPPATLGEELVAALEAAR